jgi:hypothetical protein
MFGQSLLSAFGIACTTDTDQLFTTDVQTTSLATYQLNNATTSIPSNTYPGTASNITYTAGKFGNAAVFNGTSSYVSINSSTSLQLLGDYAVSFWFKTNALSGTQRLVNKDNANDFSGGWGFSLYSDGTFNWSHNDGSNNQNWNINAGTISANTWYNICAVYSDSNNLRTFYLNGSSVGTIATNTNVAASTDNLFFGTYGASSPGPGQYFNGSLDQVRIFNSVLPQAAVTALYNETTTTAQSASVDYQLANPNSIAYYKMSDATDQLGNYNGTATNVNFNTEGKFGFAGAFNGSSSYISASGSGITGNNPFSVSIWVNSTSTGLFFFLGNSTVSGSLNTSFYISVETGGNVRVGNFGTDLFTSSASINDGSWHHVAFTSNGTTSKLYIDGSESNTTSHTWAISASLMELGRGTSNYYFNGSIDQVRIYDSALSAANVTTLYNEIECPPLTTFYTSLNPSDAVNGSLSSGNLRFTSTTTPWSQCRTVQSVSSGKYYFEMYVHSATNNSLGIGIADASLSNSGSLWGQAAGGIVYYGQSGNKFENTASVGFSSAFGPGSWLMCAFDMDAGKLWFGLNGNWIGANPSTGNSPASSIIKTYITNAKPFANAYYVGNSVEMNFGNGNSVNANTFKYTPPTGFDGILA